MNKSTAVETIKTFAKRCLPRGIEREREADLFKETHINRALRKLHGHTYVEIGVRTGKAFVQIEAPRKIGIDPAPKNFGSDLGSGEQFFQMPSDEFFSQHAEALFRDHRVDVALVDGLHEFEQALRDILHLEKYMSPGGVIFIHDCNPPTRKHAEVYDGGDWNGDVWKAAYYLTTCRRDLTFFTLNCDWGLGVLTGFRSSAAPESPSPETLAKCKSLDYSLLERKRRQILRLRPAWYSRWFFRFLHNAFPAES